MSSGTIHATQPFIKYKDVTMSLGNSNPVSVTPDIGGGTILFATFIYSDPLYYATDKNSDNRALTLA